MPYLVIGRRITLTLSEFLKDRNIPFAEREALSRHTSIRCGGVCRTFVSPKSQEELIACADFLSSAKVPWYLVGHMTNTLPPDGESDAVFVSTRAMQGIRMSGDSTAVSAGVCGAAFFRFLLGEGRMAFPALAGIPGTIGGAVRGNAGAFGYETADAVLSCEIYSTEKKKKYTVPPEEMRFSYRHSRLCEEEGEILLSATYRTPLFDRETAKAELCRLTALRHASQPLGEPSLGSVFLRVGERSAAYYIDRLGLKGRRIGGAEVSKKHAGFIVNTGGARSEDVRLLAQAVKAEVERVYGIVLRSEIYLM